MSGQPYKYSSDPAKFRDEFMKTLALQASINAMNLDANKTYAETGQLPPVSQMKDTRTTAEILADTERLKIDMIKELEPVANPQFASVVLQRIQQSPLNLDGSLFTFFVQRAPEIVRNLQKMYKYKIKGDANDAETFVKFIEDMYTKTKNMTGTVKSFFNRPATDLHNNLATVISYGDLDKVRLAFEEAVRRILLVSGSSATKDNYYYELRKMSKEITRDFLAYRDLLDKAKFIENTRHLIETEGMEKEAELGITNLDKFYDLFVRYNDIIEGFPKADTLYTLISQLDKSIKNKNPELSLRIMYEIKSCFDKVELIRDIANDIETLEYTYKPSISTHDYETTGNLYYTDEYGNKELIPFPLSESQYSSIKAREKIINEIPEYKSRESEGIEIKSLLKRRKEIEDTLKQTPVGLEQEYQDLADELRLINHQIQKIKDTKGHGLTKRRGRPKGSGLGRVSYKESIKAHQDLTKGVDEYPRFVKFGKYLVNTRKLHDNTLTLKSSSGNSVINLPSKRISANLTATIKKMINGGTIGFSDISGLSEPEKAYLHKVAKQSGILEKFDIPTPSKDMHEKDIHEFEVMKGEIMSGNDSTELIKKFKLHIMKLSRNGTLPKHEVNEILSDLVTLGY